MHHIKQVAVDPQATQINLLRHQCTELPAGNYKKKKPLWKPKTLTTKTRAAAFTSHKHSKRGSLTQRVHTMTGIDAPNVVAQSIWRDSKCPAKKYQCKACHKFGHFNSMCYQKKHTYSKPRRPKAHQLQAGTVYVCSNMSHDHLDDDSTADDSFCLQVMIKYNQKKEQRVQRPAHLITNLAYRLPHHHRNLYLRARLDTCANVNLMPASVYQLVFNDPSMKKLIPSKLQVGIYMTDTMKIIGSCTFHLVHPDT